MESVSSLCTVITASYQGGTQHAIDVSLTLCASVKKLEGEISAADMEELNDAVGHGILVLPELATAYCQAVQHIVWDAGADEQNRITAGVKTVELVLLAMRSHIKDEHTQYEGAWALGGLVDDNPGNLAGMLALGGLETLITSADIYIASWDVQGSVCWALFIMARDSVDGCAALRRSRAADVATRAKALHPGISYRVDTLLSLLSTE